MKKILLSAVALSATIAAIGLAQDRPNREQPRNFLAQARTEDGKIDLSKLPEQMPQERRDALTAADKDKDGFLTEEELKTVANRGNRGQGMRQGDGQRGPQDRGQRGPQGQGPWGQAPWGQRPQGQGFPGQRGPQGGFQPMGPMGPMGFGALKDGKLDLATLPEQMPQEVKDRLKIADKNGDGVLTEDELKDMPRPQFKFPEGKRPDFINEDNGIDVEKVVAALKSADKNEDGVIDADEQKAIGEYVRENYGPSFGFFIQQIIGEQRPFGFGGPGFGGPGFGGPRGPQGGPDGPHGPEAPQGDDPQPPQE